MAKKEQDIVFGLNKENEIKPILEDYFKCGVLNKTSKYGVIDFYNESFLFELKSRRISHNQFGTTIISQSKIDYFNKIPQKKYLIFSFIDGIYFIEYDKEIFKKFDIKNECIIRDGKIEKKINCHIPIHYLNLLK